MILFKLDFEVETLPIFKFTYISVRISDKLTFY